HVLQRSREPSLHRIRDLSRRQRSLEMAEWASQSSCSPTDFTHCNSLSSNLSDDDSHDLERFSVVASILAATEPGKRHRGFNRSSRNLTKLRRITFECGLLLRHVFRHVDEEFGNERWLNPWDIPMRFRQRFVGKNHCRRGWM